MKIFATFCVRLYLQTLNVHEIYNKIQLLLLFNKLHLFKSKIKQRKSFRLAVFDCAASHIIFVFGVEKQIAALGSSYNASLLDAIRGLIFFHKFRFFHFQLSFNFR